MIDLIIILNVLIEMDAFDSKITVAQMVLSGLSAISALKLRRLLLLVALFLGIREILKIKQFIANNYW